MSTDTFYISTDDNRYFCCSPQSGFYFSEDSDDPNIVDGSELEIKDSKDDTLRQISEQIKLSKGVHYSRKSLFQHPTEKAWLAVERRTVKKDEDGNAVKEFCAFFTRKFKRVTCISRITEKRQGNSSFRPGSKEAKLANEKSRLAKKKRLASATEVAKQLNFEPLKRLALYALGDREGLGLKEDVKQSTQMKALETYLRYSHAQLKNYSPHEVEAMRKGDNGPKINVILPADGSEVKGNVLEHKSEESLEEYLRSGSKGVYSEFEEDERNAGEYNYSAARFELPDEN